MSRQPTLAFAIACLAVLAAPGRAAPDGAKARTIVDAAIRPVMAEHAVPGMAVAVTVDGKAMFFNYGVAAKEGGAPVSEHTLFELGSISKLFTAALACHAEDAGVLSLQDRPGKYLPELKGSAVDRASLLELGTYAAGGLPLQFPAEVTDDKAMVAYFRQWQPDAEPGVQRRYSNPSIGLLGRSAALAFGSDFGTALETRLFPQLGLRASYVQVPEQAMPQYAWGYDSEGRPARIRRGVFDAEAYGVKSSTADMIRFVQANIEPQALSAPMRRALACTHVGRFEVGGTVQALGWEHYPYPLPLERLLAGNSADISQRANPARRLSPTRVPGPDTLFNKTGATRGFSAYVAYVPARRVGVVMLTNKFVPAEARIKAAYAIIEQMPAP